MGTKDRDGDSSTTAGINRFLVLSPDALPRRLEEPSVFLPARDELFELDDEAFRFLATCAATGGVPAGSVDDPGFVDVCLAEGILQRSPRPGPPRAIPIDPSPHPSLRYLEVQITRRCNLACRHCYLGDAAPVDLEPDRFARICDDLYRMQGLRLLVSGGEPLCHPAFSRINEVLAASPLRSVLLTNGMALTDSWLSRLAVDEIQVSLDGMKAGHEMMRGPGTFDRAVAALTRARTAGFEISAATMAHRGNLGELDRLDGFLRDFGVAEWSVDVPCPSGRWPRTDLTWEEAGTALSFGFGGSLHGGGGGSTCGTHLMAITPDGSGAKCGFYADRPVGSIEEGLGVLWERVPRPALDTLTCRCEHLATCRGGCRYRAEVSGDPRGPDPVKCAAHGVRPGGLPRNESPPT